LEILKPTLNPHLKTPSSYSKINFKRDLRKCRTYRLWNLISSNALSSAQYHHKVLAVEPTNCHNLRPQLFSSKASAICLWSSAPVSPSSNIKSTTLGILDNPTPFHPEYMPHGHAQLSVEDGVHTLSRTQYL